MIDLMRSISDPASLSPRSNFGPTAVAPQAPAEPSPAPVGGTKKNDELGRDEFLQLLVAQMRNQDPLNPMDGQELAAQLAQFSQVEQLLDINGALEQQNEMQAGIGIAIEDLTDITLLQGDALAKLMEQSMAISTVGRTGMVDGNNMFVDRNGSGSFTVDTGETSGLGRLIITNEAGEDVDSVFIPNVGKGMQSFNLEDLDTLAPLDAGKYSFRFDVRQDDGSYQPAKTFTSGRITGLTYEQGKPVLILGDSLRVPFTSLLQIRG